ncbi:MAG: efflux RND transporter periplasmic adaptor subunit [Alphaproteobacteria bacterium]|nr:MAG: efflux RND transporter periplasmic adaptor subunit [Alphaproteobacteria bacterium]
MKPSYRHALIVLVIIGLWVGSRYLWPGAEKADTGNRPAVEKNERKLFRVRVRTLEARPFVQHIIIRARTEPLRRVAVKAQVEGMIERVAAEKGSKVAAGDLLCLLEKNERRALLEEARALAAQRKLEYDAARKLARQGHRSEIQVAAARAQYEAALARVKQMEVALAHTEIRAPFAGLVVDRPVETGDYLMKGGICAEVMQLDPFLAVGEVPETEVERLTVGAPAEVRLANGRTIKGTIRFVAATANETTRTFRVEVEISDPLGEIREGLSARVRVPVHEVMAHRVPASIFVLASDGRLGLRSVDDSGHVRFHAVRMLEDTEGAVWVAGLPERVRIITVGQDFVQEGEEVDPVEEDAGSDASPIAGTIVPEARGKVRSIGTKERGNG